MKRHDEVRSKLAVVAREVVAEFGLSDPFGVTEEHINAAYVRLWDWDKLSVEMMTDHERVRVALERAVDEARPKTDAGEESF